ncbi:hypothetical protein TWF694_011899 [Orbilia ellipsospora]|uniref:Rab-GAP TBC domain-containing protein n=1 Tax=Orbilia ellipsospora TaxID=2528407 RepID=A0AAV9X7V2_9PEZI
MVSETGVDDTGQHSDGSTRKCSLNRLASPSSNQGVGDGSNSSPLLLKPLPPESTNPRSICELDNLLPRTPISISQDDHQDDTPAPSVSALAYPQPNFAHANISKVSLQGAGRSLIRDLTIEEELLSLKVRSLYDSGVRPSESHSLLGSAPSGSIRAGLEMNRLSAISATSNRSTKPQTMSSSARNSTANSASSLNLECNFQDTRAEFELAGGVEDWEDVDADDIDRYGFIMPKPVLSPANDPKGNTSGKPRRMRPISTIFIRRGFSKRQTRPASVRSRFNVLKPPFQTRIAPEMLTSPIAGSNERMKAKEVQRVAKWHHMARKSDGLSTGGSTYFNFPTSDPKLIERTWKGIPDCWRSAAWFSFLESSASKRDSYTSNEDLIACYHNLLLQNSPDDVQIDLDVPRTISSHIMFRRRYRGGQRLLFRVLHAISLHFPDIGYVQGMASLAATFLCYYDEDAAFIMLVRLFELRGLHTIYSNGFGGLMDALNELDTEWLRRSHPLVSQKLEALGISVLSFGTRWYLTLFNYSIPFAAQLRVWDVFLLLGDGEEEHGSEGFGGFGGILDVLHATSAALIDGMEDLVLGSDFEGSMKCLTSWIPIKDEDILMQRVKVEWRRKRRHKLVDRLPRTLLPNTNLQGIGTT